MPLLNNRPRRRRLLKTVVPKPLPPFTVVRCPLEGHQVSMCRGLCKPLDGFGYCGRVAAHAMVGRTQQAIREDILRRRGA